MTDTIHRSIEARARARPDARAVVHEGVALSYAELDARSNRLAHHLVERGVGPEVIVGVHMDRSLELVVAMLAVMKAGGAYLPLDPNYPADRNAFMLADGKALVVITDRLLSAAFDGACVDVKADAEQIAGQSSDHVARGVDGSNLAYVMYTSGSTGRPKGVMIPHDRVTRLISATAPWFHFTEADVWSFWHSYAFDVSVWEIWGALIHGGSVVVVSDAVRRSPDDFLALLSREHVSVLSQIPSAFRPLIAAAVRSPDPVPLALRYVIFAGEALELRGLVPWFERYPSQPTLVNMYGITETTVHATFRVIEPAECAAPEGSPIGVPIPDLELHVLDAHGRPVADGVEGEIYIGGKGLARGYHARASLTAERFIPDPFSGRSGDRLYKSGDLARRRADGSLEYLGRNDTQVKIRGFRIETGEIASLLTTHPGVREAAVVAKEVDEGDRRLVAYVALEAAATADELAAFLAARLPAYMVPSMFVTVSGLPITPSGKIDFGALPAPDWSSKVDDGGASPQTPIEIALATLWCEVLRVPRVGTRDDFFELGGHSLLAIKLAAKIRTALSVDVTIAHLFAAPTIEQLAVEIARMRRETTSLASIARVSRDGALPLANAQERIWFVERMLRRDSPRPFNTAFAVEMQGAVDADRLAHALADLVARHEILRTTFELAGRQLVQVIGAPFSLPLAPTTLGPVEGADRIPRLDKFATELARPPFDLEKDHLIRARFVTFAPGDHVLLLVLHHIIFDGMTVRVLVDELAELYAGGSLPPLAIQYADIAAWQRAALVRAEKERQLEYWRDRLEGARLVEIPPDLAPAVRSDAGDHVPIDLDRGVTDAIRELARSESASTFMTVVAALVTVIAKRSGVDDVVVGTVASAREHPDLERAVGLLLNVLVLRVNVSGDPSFRELVQRVRLTVSEAFAHRDVPFDAVIASLNRKPDPRRGLYQFMISLDSTEAGAPAGWTLSTRNTGAVADDVSLELLDDGSRLSGTLGYRTDVFTRSTAEALAGELCDLLARGAAHPERPLSTL